MKTVYLFLATGFEEIEALTIVDMLRRAEIDITTVSISRNLQVEGAHGITVTADCTWVELSTEDADWLILPGGMPGTKHLGECKPLVSLLQRQAAANKNIAAICAAPSVLSTETLPQEKVREPPYRSPQPSSPKLPGKKKPVRSRAACYCKSSKPYR